VNGVRSSRQGAVIVGGHVNGLGAARSLADHGVPVAVVCTGPTDLAHRSRLVREHVHLPAFRRRPAVLVDLLERRRDRWRGWMVLPAGDLALEVLARHRERLSSRYRVAAPTWSVARVLLRKDLLHEAATRAGVEVPRCYGVATEQTVAQEGIIFPVVLKPVDSQRFWDAFHRKLLVARDRAELRRRWRELEASGHGAIIQELVPGPDDLFCNYSVYMSGDGRPVAELAMRKLRKSPPFFGVCRVGHAMVDGDLARGLRRRTLTLLEHVGWHGMANAEFKIDPRDGRLRLMEINGRCFLMQGLARRAGVNYPLLAWQDLVRGRVDHMPPNGWRGHWIHLHQDALHALVSRRDERLSWRDYIRPYRSARAFAVWSARDPLPFVMESMQAGRQALRLLLNETERRSRRARIEMLPPGTPTPWGVDGP
jgi:predicted ATP-grasp superfamily ATP-dependent carboligase